MYLIKKEGNYFNKYEVDVDYELLKILRLEIINNCSLIEHKKEELSSDLVPCEWEYNIRNLKKQKIGWTKTNDELYYPSKELYLCEYDQLKYPYLITIIDEILKENINFVDKLFYKIEELEEENILDRINKLSNEINEISNTDYNKKLKKLDDLKKLIIKAELNKNQKSINEYYIKVRNSIKFNLIDSVNVEDAIKICEFFNADIDYEKTIIPIKKMKK